LKAGEILTPDYYSSGVDLDQAEHGLQQGGFTGTVGANNADQFTLAGLDGATVEDVDARNVARHQVGDFDDRIAGRGICRGGHCTGAAHFPSSFLVSTMADRMPASSVPPPDASSASSSASSTLMPSASPRSTSWCAPR